MSRLDYVTIAIVAVCVAALVYLIYMTTNLLGDSGESPATTETTAPAESEDTGEDTYYFDDRGGTEAEEPGGSLEESSPAGADEASNYDYRNDENLDEGSSSAAAAKQPEETDAGASRPAEENYTGTKSAPSSNTGSAGGAYMVIGGTFSSEENARKREKAFRDLGYTNVTLEPFDRGKYTAVMVGRFNSLGEAQSLVSELKSKGQEAYIKKKQ